MIELDERRENGLKWKNSKIRGLNCKLSKDDSSRISIIGEFRSQLDAKETQRTKMEQIGLGMHAHPRCLYTARLKFYTDELVSFYDSNSF